MTPISSVWFTAGFHHIPRVEDWPVMSTEWKTIHLMPMNFFAMNPAATIRLPAGDEAALPVEGAAPCRCRRGGSRSSTRGTCGRS